MSKVFVIDVSRCSGCHNCQLACKDEHCGNDWGKYAKPQPEIGQFWVKVEETVQGSRPKLKMHYMPHLCNHCKNPSCVAAARDGAVYQREDGLIIIDPEKAAGQKQIADACPYGAIYWNEELSLPQKCTGCAHLLDNGSELPRCVEACPTGAMMFGEEEELRDHIMGAQVLNPELGLAPQVYYRNIPGLFVAGTIFDPDADEVIEGAACRLNNGGKVWKTTTDQYGDYWFKDLPAGIYDLVIEAKGYEVYSKQGLRLEESVNMGDMPFKKID